MPTFDEQYQQVINTQREHLTKVQADFNTACEAAKTKAKEKLKNVPLEDKAGREAVLQAEKKELDEALHVLKLEVDHSTKETMRKLEEIIHEKEKLFLEKLEDELSKL